MPRQPYTTHSVDADAKIERLVAAFDDRFDRRLLGEMLTAVYRLGEDRASTGDLKILTAAIKELRYAFKIFKPYRRFRKVAMFGSARLPRRHPAYPMALRFGRLMAQSGWLVITGAASGVMRAGHEGSGRAMSFGLNIRLPFEQAPNPVIAGTEKLINCKYFFTRKLLFIKESHATVLFPGGFGTLDEGFESLTLVQTGKSDPRPIVFIDTPRGNFWGPMLKFFDQLIREEMVSPSDQALYQRAQSAEEAVKMILQFYDVYHSLRYVKDQTVLRLNRPLPPDAPAKLTSEFSDLLKSGTIRQGAALAEEADEPHLATLPRLIFKFNRREHGQLIQLIHRINELGAPRKT